MDAGRLIVVGTSEIKVRSSLATVNSHVNTPLSLAPFSLSLTPSPLLSLSLTYPSVVVAVDHDGGASMKVDILLPPISDVV